MASCSNSSNIRSSVNAITITNGGGSRLLATLPSIAGVTAGQVIRYDVLAAGYTTAIASDASTSEVFGVVEAYNSTTNTMNVVVYGSINMPNTYVFDMGSGGGCGGNDIYFLSGTTKGALQNLAPVETNYVIKPIYQVAPHGNFTGIVMNYLGYKIGGDVEASLVETQAVGSISYVLGGSLRETTFEDGVVEANVSHALPISSYSEFYNLFGLSFGYVERLHTTTTIPASVNINQTASQTASPTAPPYDGKVFAIDTSNNYLLISRPPDAPRAEPSKPILITVASGTVSIPIDSTEIYATLTPTIQTNQTFQYGLWDNSPISLGEKITLKVKPKGIQVSIPDTVTVVNLVASGISLAGQDLNARISALE